MGATKEKHTGCFDPENVQHIFTVAFSRRPPMSASEAMNFIVGRDRLRCEKQQGKHSLLSEALQLIETALGEGSERVAKVCNMEKRA